MYFMTFIGYIAFCVIGAQVFVPIYHRMELTSAHEYLQRRFNYPIRLIGSLIFMVQMLLYLAVVLYAPALAFSTVTGISIHILVAALGVNCALYTTMGGLNAVIWTDTFQMAVIIIGLLALLIKGTLNEGGIVQVWNTARDGGRLIFDNISPDPRERYTIWSQSIGATFQLLPLIGANQIIIQRFLSIRKTRDAIYSAYAGITASLVILFMCTILGLVLHAHYQGCDPMVSQQVKKIDQIVPMFMMQTLGDYHGLPGLFTAAVFSAALSTVSSAVNSLAAVCLEDIIRPIHATVTGKKQINEDIATWISKGLALFFGLLTIGLSYIAPHMGDLLAEISLSIFGTLGGPLLGLFVLGIFFPFVNCIGAGAGVIGSVALTYWVHISALIYNKPAPILKISIAQCPRPTTIVNNISTTAAYTTTFLEGVQDTLMEFTTSLTTDTLRESTSLNTNSVLDVTVEQSSVKDLYRISYMWYGLFSVFVALIIGIIVSLLTGCRRGMRSLPRNLFFQWSDNCCCCCPHLCHCGDTEGNEYTYDVDQLSDQASVTEERRNTPEAHVVLTSILKRENDYNKDGLQYSKEKEFDNVAYVKE